MNRRSLVPVVLGVVVVAGLMAAAAGIQLVRERAFPLPELDEPALYLTSGSALRRMTIGYSALAADVYWIRAIQHFGDKRLGRGTLPNTAKDAFPLLYPLLDLTTTLDPRFNIAYRFGAIFLAEPAPGGAGRPDLAISLLEKGLREDPAKWEYVQDIGFVHYWWLRDYREAGEWFERASRMSGAPWWMTSLAATTKLQGGDRASSRQMWQAVRESADNDWLRGSADRALMQLRALDQIDELQRIVDGAAMQAGTPPPLSGRVVRINGQVVVDPVGVPYQVDPAGRVRLGPQSSLFPLPDQPVHVR